MHIRVQYIVRIYEENAEKTAFSIRQNSVLFAMFFLKCRKYRFGDFTHSLCVDFQ